MAPHFFTTRSMPLASSEDWQRLAGVIDASDTITVNQVHGRDVLVVRQGGRLPEGRSAADAIASNDLRLAVAVRGADCAPILLADARTGAVAAVHAGWRGTAARVVTAALEALAAEFGSRPEDVVAAIGPRIGACCYQVGSELVDAFADAGHQRHLVDRWFVVGTGDRGLGTGEQGSGIGDRGPGAKARGRMSLDIARANADQLILAGVPEHNIHDCGLCTAMHLEVLTSFRVEREKAVRIAGVIRAQPPRPSLHSPDGRHRG